MNPEQQPVPEQKPTEVQETQNPPVQETQPVKPEKKKLPLPLVGVIAGTVIIILIAFIGILAGISILKRPAPMQTLITPVPTIIPTTTITIVPNTNSKYASDAAFLKLREDLKTLNQEIGTVNFFEPEISPPNIDLNIQIK